MGAGVRLHRNGWRDGGGEKEGGREGERKREERKKKEDLGEVTRRWYSLPGGGVELYSAGTVYLA